jgi:hypothetical protein
MARDLRFIGFWRLSWIFLGIGFSNAPFLPEGNPNAAAQERNAAPEALEPVFGDRL